jgi:peptidoglycan/LPS O-acetylase OafA/YrhL
MKIDSVRPALHDHRRPAAHLAYRPDIDGLRAIAIFSVVCFHAFPTLIGGGFVGVDVFFVISGFLITSIVLKALERGTFSFTGFYARRVTRIFPALILVMAAAGWFSWFALFPDEYERMGKHMFGGAAFSSNFFLWNEVGYFDTAAETKPLLHLWSLGIEEQFYIVWPALLFLAWKRGLSALKLTLALAGLSFLINVAGVHHYPSATFYSPASRAWELLIGALVACRASRHTRLPDLGRLALGQAGAALEPDRWRGRLGPRARDAQSMLGVALLALAFCLVAKGRSFPGWWALLPTVGAALLIGAGPDAWFNRVVLSNRVARWFGLISYPLYLWHWPLLSFAQIVESGVPAPQMRAAAVLAAIVLAWLTYRFLERPLQNWRQAAWSSAMLSLAMALVAVCGLVIFQLGGLPRRATIVENAQMQKSLIIVEDVQNAAACKKRYAFSARSQYCLLAQLDREPSVVLLGDSHAYHLVAGLTKYYSARGENLLYLGTGIPFWGKDRRNDEFQRATAPMLDLALKTASIKTVIIATALKLQTENDNIPERMRNFRDTLARFTKAGKEVIYVNDVPVLDFDPRACIRRAGIVSSKTKFDCSMSRGDFEKNTAIHDANIRSVLAGFPAVRLFSTAPYLCDARRCRAIIDGKLMYRDTNHLSYDGDLYIGQQFAREQLAHEPPKR